MALKYLVYLVILYVLCYEWERVSNFYYQLKTWSISFFHQIRSLLQSAGVLENTLSLNSSSFPNGTGNKWLVKSSKVIEILVYSDPRGQQQLHIVVRVAGSRKHKLNTL